MMYIIGMNDTYIAASDLHYFLEISRALNLSRAAERLGVRQSTLSLAIQRLESILDTKLLVRSRKGVRLTTTGQLLLDQSEDFLERWKTLKRSVKKGAEEIGGRLIIGCHSSVALYSLPKFLKKLLRDHPNLEIHLTHGLSRVINESVISAKVDFGIVINPSSHPDLVIREIATDEVTFWQGENPISDILICDPDLAQTRELSRRLKRNQTPFRRSLESSDLEVIAKLTAEGCGIGVLPTRVALKYGSRLRKLSGSWPQYHDQLCLVYRADIQKTATVRLIIEAIRSAQI